MVILENIEGNDNIFVTRIRFLSAFRDILDTAVKIIYITYYRNVHDFYLVVNCLSFFDVLSEKL